MDTSLGIVRMEFLGGERLYAMRVISHGGFNLRPSEVCNPADETEGYCAIPEEKPAGRLVFYDVNSNSNLRAPIAKTFGFDPFESVLDDLVQPLG